LVESPELREKMSHNAKDIATSQFKWERVVEQYESMWDELKERALSEERKTEDSYSFSPRYADIFSHYTTHLFSDSMVVKIRPSGIELLNGGGLPPIYSEMSLVLDQEIIVSILQTVVEQNVLVSDFTMRSHSKFQTTMLWMAKYDLVELISSVDA